MPNISSWISPKASKGQPSSIAGKGLFCVEQIKKGEIVAVKLGHFMDKEALDTNADVVNEAFIQIADDKFLAPTTHDEFLDTMTYINHSCDASVGIGGNILLVAMRNIEKDEELTVDYATQWANPALEINPCNCGSQLCRGRVTGEDWNNPELQKKYAGYFSWYIEQKIKALKNTTEL